MSVTANALHRLLVRFVSSCGLCFSRVSGIGGAVSPHLLASLAAPTGLARGNGGAESTHRRKAFWIPALTSILSLAASVQSHAVVVFTQNFNAGAPGWTTQFNSGSSFLWHTTTTGSRDGTQHYWCGSESTGNFDFGLVQQGVVSPSFNLSGYSAATLTFWETISTENLSNYDRCYVQASINGGISWTDVRPYAYQTSGWIFRSYSMNAFVGQSNVQLRFYFDTVDGVANNFSGWHFDDVVVDGTASVLPPVVVTSPASGVGVSVATLNGTVNPRGAATNARFRYGTDATLAVGTDTGLQAVGSGSTALPISQALTGLSAHTLYYYRATASSSSGTVNGSILNFTTGNTAPTAPNQGIFATTGDARVYTITFPSPDADGDVVTLASVTPGPHLTVNTIVGSVVTFTADSNYAGPTALSYTVSDGFGGTAGGTINVTVTDNDAPTAFCQNVTVSLDAFGNGLTTAAAVNNASTDNIGVTGLALSQTNFTCANLGPNSVILTVTDAAGNFATCNATVTVVDQIDPTLTCPPPVTVQCPFQNPPPNPASLTALDNCDTNPAVTHVTDVVTGGMQPCNYVITRTYMAVDDSGNDTTCEQVITVNDTLGPVITQPASNLTVECDGNGNLAQLANWLNTHGGGTALDNCSGVTWSHDFTGLSDDCGATGSASVTFTATDACGNNIGSTTTAAFTIVDTQGPLITIANAVVEYGSSILPAATGTATALDTCSGSRPVTWVDVSDVWNDIGCGALGMQVVHVITRRWSATDACGNLSTHDQIITVRDTRVPRISLLTLPEVDIECSMTAMTPVPVVTPAPEGTTRIPATLDNPAPVPAEMTYVDVTNLVSSCAYTVTRTWTATDDGCNTAIFVQTINVRDTLRPTVKAPPTALVPHGGSLATNQLGVATAVDACDASPAISYADVTNSVGCAYNLDIVRTWTAVDDCGNTHTANQLIRVRDTVAPVFATQPPDAGVECGSPTDPAATGTPTATDNTPSAVSLSHRDDVNPASCPSRRVITRTWTALDACGNASTHVQTITVVDSAAPVLVLPADAVVELGASTSPAATGTAVATDVCDNWVTVTFTNTVDLMVSPPEVMLIVRTWTAVDDCGNVATGDQEISVVDTTPPMVSWPLDTVVPFGGDTSPATTGSPSATDNSGSTGSTFTDSSPPQQSQILVVTPPPETGGCPPEQVILREWTVSDASGNKVTHVQMITTTDGNAPSITQHPEDLTVAPGAPATFTVTAAGCGLSYQWTRNGVEVPGATGSSCTVIAGPGDNGAQYACRVRTSLTVVSRSAVLWVQGSIDFDAPVAPTLEVRMSEANPGALLFSFTTELGYLYYLQATSDASGGEWLNLADPVPGDGGVVEIEVSSGETANTMFRLLALPNIESGAQP